MQTVHANMSGQTKHQGYMNVNSKYPALSNDKRLISQHLAVRTCWNLQVSGYVCVISKSTYIIFTDSIRSKVKSVPHDNCPHHRNFCIHNSPPRMQSLGNSCFFVLHALDAFCRKSSLSVGRRIFSTGPGISNYAGSVHLVEQLLLHFFSVLNRSHVA